MDLRDENNEDKLQISEEQRINVQTRRKSSLLSAAKGQACHRQHLHCVLSVALLFLVRSRAATHSSSPALTQNINTGEAPFVDTGLHCGIADVVEE